jgi:hypothetical protein
MALSFATTFFSQLMIVEVIISRIRLVTTTSIMDTWSSWVMSRSVRNEAHDVKHTTALSIHRAHFFKQRHTRCLGWHHV